MSETRKLVAILVADVVGYSRLAGADEERTLARLRGLRSDLIDPAIAAHHGRIVNVGAQSALQAASGFGPYAASKSAVHRLTESLAAELKLKGVTVNAVLPSIIDTPLNRRDMPKADFDRWVAPADLAAVMLFLASDEAKAVTGALIPVTGQV